MSDSSSTSESSSVIDHMDQISERDSEEDLMIERNRSYEERINYMQKYDELEFIYRFRLSKSVNNSELRAECEAGIYGNRWLLGDSAYPCKTYLLTPLLNPQTNSEMNYNRAHIKTRNTIERCFGVWKRRFPVISLKIRLAMDTTQAVIIATAVLHNICRQTNLEDVDPEIDIPNHSINFRTEDIPESHSGNQFQERQSLIHNYFR